MCVKMEFDGTKRNDANNSDINASVPPNDPKIDSDSPNSSESKSWQLFLAAYHILNHFHSWGYA